MRHHHRPEAPPPSKLPPPPELKPPLAAAATETAAAEATPAAAPDHRPGEAAAARAAEPHHADDEEGDDRRRQRRRAGSRSGTSRSRRPRPGARERRASCPGRCSGCGQRSARRRRGRSPCPASRSRAARARASRRSRRAARELFASDKRADAVDRDVEAAGEVAGLERGQDLLADDAAGDDVGDRALQRRSDPDVNVAVVLRDREQEPVADFLASRTSSSTRRAARTRRCPRGARSARSGSRSARRVPSRSWRAWRSAHRPAPASASPVWSMTRPVRTGTGTTSSARAGPRASAASSAAAARSSAHGERRPTRGESARRGLLEAHRRRHRDLRFVGDREVRLGLVAEDHRREVGRHAAHLGVVLLHRGDVLVARDGDAVLGAFELDAQVLERRVGLQVRIVLA